MQHFQKVNHLSPPALYTTPVPSNKKKPRSHQVENISPFPLSLPPTKYDAQAALYGFDFQQVAYCWQNLPPLTLPACSWVTLINGVGGKEEISIAMIDKPHSI